MLRNILGIIESMEGRTVLNKKCRMGGRVWASGEWGYTVYSLITCNNILSLELTRHGEQALCCQKGSSLSSIIMNINWMPPIRFSIALKLSFLRIMVLDSVICKLSLAIAVSLLSVFYGCLAIS